MEKLDRTETQGGDSQDGPPDTSACGLNSHDSASARSRGHRGVGGASRGYSSVSICLARAGEAGIILGLVEELLAELGEEAKEFARLDTTRLETDLERGLSQPLLGPSAETGRTSTTRDDLPPGRETKARNDLPPGRETTTRGGPGTSAEAFHGSGGRFAALLAQDVADTAIGLLTLSTGFAAHAGGEYGIVEEMYVRPAFRNQGVGELLLEEALKIARAAGWSRLEVTGPVAADTPDCGAPSSQGENPASSSAGRTLRFYQRHGFEYSGPKLRILLHDNASDRSLKLGLHRQQGKSLV